MKWLILKFMVWFYTRRWEQHVQLVSASTDANTLDCVILNQCLNAFRPILIQGVKREEYVEYEIITSTTNISMVKHWLTEYVTTLKAYNVYILQAQRDPSTERPEVTYITEYGVTLSEPLKINLADYMRAGSNEYTHHTLSQVLTLVKEASAELELIDDEIEYEYYVRRASYVIDDVWAVLSTFIKANKLYAHS